MFLPIQAEDQSFYQKNGIFWDYIERRDLEVYVHAVSFTEALTLQKDTEANVSVDLTKEMEKSFRIVDQDRLRKEILEIF